ncbi:2-hydroxyacid dehydrogenase [Sneathiella chinensis]|uniref:Glyoxylate/hydroxypyruvate reductase A n=1 Tax=Sneathiella chinensis TaxID=349750 RepID=A0ABQ5U8E3_9PROT|nr:glyoxylate/hydroxypyruvate reductase A [Sneathiella chinensis]GLQ06746.1 glyoxylate/hydroxypyruvate reductase A [Sneathiella chinensis]
MHTPIPFVGQVSPEEERLWLSALSAALPEEQIVPLASLDEAQRDAARIAIVANPNPADLATLPNLEWIQSVWAGVERMLAELADRPFQIVRLVDPELARTMAEAVLAWTLYLHRDMPAYARQQKSRVWQERTYLKPSDKTVGILGVGNLGKQAAESLKGACFNVIGWSRSPKSLPGVETLSGAGGLHHLVSRSDIVVCLLPLTPETRGLIDQAVLGRFRKGSGFINFGRGAVVNADDLLAALDQGRLDHAVLDVFEQEPLPADHPFWDHPGVTVLPHISAPTDRETASRIVACNIGAFRQDGTLPETVDRKRGY